MSVELLGHGDKDGPCAFPPEMVDHNVETVGELVRQSTFQIFNSVCIVGPQTKGDDDVSAPGGVVR